MDLTSLRRSGSRLLRALDRRVFATVPAVHTSRPLVALTFDDGPDPIFTPLLLDILEEYGARATFFVLGEQARRYPSLLMRIIKGGHELGNHTDTHPSLPRHSTAAQWREIRACHRTLRQHTRPRWFRPPYGHQTRRTAALARAAGYRIATWSGMAEDWTALSSDQILANLERELRPGAVLLLHDRLHTYSDPAAVDRRPMLEAVRALLECHADRYTFATLSTLADEGRPERIVRVYAPDTVSAGKTTVDVEALTTNGHAERVVNAEARSAVPVVPDVSVVIPCYNNAATLPAQLEALAQQDSPCAWEIIVADNGSTDHLADVITAYASRLPRLRVVDASDVQGAAHARNVGVRHSAAKWLLFCDADDVVGEGWLRAMHAALGTHDFVAGRFAFDRLNPPWRIGSRSCNQVTGLSTSRHRPHAGAGNMGIRRSVFVEAGGFDERVHHLEDMEFCWRVQDRGTPLIFVPDAVLHVRTRESLRKAFFQMMHWATQDRLLHARYGHACPEGETWTDVWRVFRDGMPQQLRALRKARTRQVRYGRMQDLGWFLGSLRGMIRTRRGASTPPTNGERTDRRATRSVSSSDAGREVGVS